MSLSKYFDVAMKGRSCTDIFHPGGSCWQATVSNFTKPLPTCAKFFTPIFCIQLLRKGIAGNFNKDTLPELLYAFLATTMTGYLGSACGQTCCCIAYHLLGKLYLHSCVLVPVCLGNFWGFYMPDKVNSYFADYLSMMIIEAYYRCEETFYWRLIKNSNLVRTVLFMMMSAFILTTNRNLKSDVVWFIQTIQQNEKRESIEELPAVDSSIFDRLLPVDRQICRHLDSCDSHVYKGVKSSLKLGLAIEMARFLLENFSAIQKSPSIVFNMFSRIKIRVVTFFVAYTAAYRILNCALNRYYKENSSKGNTLSAFLSAAVFYVYPDLTMLSHATVSTVKLLWMRYISGPAVASNTSKKASSLTTWLAALPISRLVYMFSIGYVFHLRLLYPWLCSAILFKTTFFTSGFISDGVTMNAAKYLLGNQ